MQETQETRIRSLGQEDLWRRKWQPSLVFLPGEFHGHRSLGGYSPWGCKELDMTKCTHTHTHTQSKDSTINTTTWMDFEDIALSEIKKTQRQIVRDSTYMK